MIRCPFVSHQNVDVSHQSADMSPRFGRDEPHQLAISLFAQAVGRYAEHQRTKADHFIPFHGGHPGGNYVA